MATSQSCEGRQSALTHHDTLKQLVRLNLVQGRVQKVVFSKIAVVVIVQSTAELLGLRVERVSMLGLVRHISLATTYLVTEELEIGSTLVLDISRGTLLLLLLRVRCSGSGLLGVVPIRLFIGPLFVICVIVGRIKLEVVPEGVFAVFCIASLEGLLSV